MPDIFSYAFVQRAIIAAVLSGALCPAVGSYIVQRRLSLLGDGLGHIAVAGVGLALLTNTAPLPVAIGVCVAGAVLIEFLRSSGRASADVGLAILFYGGLAGGVMLAGLAGRGTSALSSYLFGSLTTVSSTDLYLMAGLAIVVIALSLLLEPQFFAVCADEEYARTQGLPVRALNMLIVIMAALTVSLSLRTVGVLLVSALMVIPVAAASNVATGFRASMFLSIGVGVAVSFGGTLASIALDTPSGATIVLLAIALFLVSAVFTLRKRQIAADEPPELAHHPASDTALSESTEAAADDTAILHGDHVDYLHHGHRHAPHGDHYDEH
jgi:zinc transport system permease protein